MASLLIDHEYLINTLTDLVRIDSTNPSCTPNGAGEAEIAKFAAKSMQAVGLSVEIFEPEPSRLNALGKLTGHGNGRSLMLNAHTDTVGVEGMKIPFSALIQDGKLFGRGSQDMKGSLAACMSAAKAIVDAGILLAGDLYIAAVADEEFVSLGTKDLLKHCKTDAAIVTEPTDLGICIAHKGSIWLELETIGRAAHGSRYQDGIDANMHMGRILHELESLERDLRRRTPHPLTGPPSLHASKIAGGTEWSVYAAQCTLKVERRIIPGENLAQVIADFHTILGKLKMSDENFNATLNTFSLNLPHEIPQDAEIVTALQKASAQVLDREPLIMGQAFWTDAALLGGEGIECVLIGPVGAGLHTNEEWVDIKSVIQLAEILAQTAAAYCA